MCFPAQQSIQQCGALTGCNELTVCGKGYVCVVCVCLSVYELHNEWSTMGMFRTLAIPVFFSLLLQVDIAVGGVVG